jgi:hypothetical protein
MGGAAVCFLPGRAAEPLGQGIKNSDLNDEMIQDKKGGRL